MKKETVVTLNETDVLVAISEYVKKHYGSGSVTDISFTTGVRGSYDKGNAEEYVKSVDCRINTAPRNLGNMINF